LPIAVARNLFVDLQSTRYYRCISRYVRQVFLYGEGHQHRGQWIEKRLELLIQHFAAYACGFAIMDNQLHGVVQTVRAKNRPRARPIIDRVPH
jgi:hypothetical protein